MAVSLCDSKASNATRNSTLYIVNVYSTTVREVVYGNLLRALSYTGGSAKFVQSICATYEANILRTVPQGNTNSPERQYVETVCKGSLRNK